MAMDRTERALLAALVVLGVSVIALRWPRVVQPPLAEEPTAPVNAPSVADEPPLQESSLEPTVAEQPAPPSTTMPPVIAAEKGPPRVGSTRAAQPAAEASHTEAPPSEVARTAEDTQQAVSIDSDLLQEDRLQQIGRTFAAGETPWPALIVAFDQETAERLLMTAGGWLVAFNPDSASAIREIGGGARPTRLRALPASAPTHRMILPLTNPSPELRSWVAARWTGGPVYVGWLAPADVNTRLIGMMAVVLSSAGEAAEAVQLIRGRWEGATPRFIPVEIRLRSGEVRPVNLTRGGGT